MKGDSFLQGFIGQGLKIGRLLRSQVSRAGSGSGMKFLYNYIPVEQLPYSKLPKCSAKSADF
jgi:hypothetical protein